MGKGGKVSTEKSVKAWGIACIRPELWPAVIHEGKIPDELLNLSKGISGQNTEHTNRILLVSQDKI